ncbi:hypothetical protein X883_4533 [Burkholderia pseudomallei MSHR4304]|nr:hypothetical protein X883_4533 [Burkholderia pseudomallei MSHR4304]
MKPAPARCRRHAYRCSVGRDVGRGAGSRRARPPPAAARRLRAVSAPLGRVCIRISKRSRAYVFDLGKRLMRTFEGVRRALVALRRLASWRCIDGNFARVEALAMSGYAVTRLRGYAVTRLRGHAVMRSCGHAVTRSRGASSPTLNCSSAPTGHATRASSASPRGRRNAIAARRPRNRYRSQRRYRYTLAPASSGPHRARPQRDGGHTRTALARHASTPAGSRHVASPYGATRAPPRTIDRVNPHAAAKPAAHHRAAALNRPARLAYSRTANTNHGSPP